MYSTYGSFLVINVCNQGKTLCSPCILNINVPQTIPKLCVISGFRRAVNEDIRSSWTARPFQMGRIGCFGTSLTNLTHLSCVKSQKSEYRIPETSHLCLVVHYYYYYYYYYYLLQLSFHSVAVVLTLVTSENKYI